MRGVVFIRPLVARSLSTLFLTGVLGATVLSAQDLPNAAAASAEAATAAAPLAGAKSTAPADWDSIRDLADRIDAELAARWLESDVLPAGLATEAEYLRRVYLDLNGRIPPASVARDFLANPFNADRRALVDRLLEEPAYATNMARLWRGLLIPEADNNLQLRFLSPGTESWLRGKFVAAAPYDEIARELITTKLPAPPSQGQMQQNFFEQLYGATPLGFFMAKQGKPENLAAGAARIFLGVQIECAQCHDHPFDDWKREQFWSLAGFFAGVTRQQQDQDFSPLFEKPNERQITIGGTDTVVPALYLDGSKPEWTDSVSPREALANWITAKDNPYFARAAVNRLWKHFFGRGIVDPVDDFGPGNPPSHPELLDLLAREFVAHDFDLQYLTRALVSTRAYQLTSAVSDPSQQDPGLFAVMPVRALEAEALLASLDEAIGFQDPNTLTAGFNPFGGDQSRTSMLDTFNRGSDNLTESETSIIQALTLMNGPVVAGATTTQAASAAPPAMPQGAPYTMPVAGAGGHTLRAVTEFPGLSTREQLEMLYLATLSRVPRAEELERLLPHVDQSADAAARTKALGDVFWALLNSSEFLTNH